MLQVKSCWYYGRTDYLSFFRLADVLIDLQHRPLQHLEEIIICGHEVCPLRSDSDLDNDFDYSTVMSFYRSAVYETLQVPNIDIWMELELRSGSSGITKVKLCLTLLTTDISVYNTACTNPQTLLYQNIISSRDGQPPAWRFQDIYTCLKGMNDLQDLCIKYQGYLPTASMP